jgi:hypothetical protein
VSFDGDEPHVVCRRNQRLCDTLVDTMLISCTPSVCRASNWRVGA